VPTPPREGRGSRPGTQSGGISDGRGKRGATPVPAAAVWDADSEEEEEDDGGGFVFAAEEPGPDAAVADADAADELDLAINDENLLEWLM
jgi:hypothetical protein